MIDIKRQADKLVEECEKKGFSATVAISDPNNKEWGGFVGNTGPVYCLLANLAGVFLAISRETGVHTDRLIYDVRKAIKTYMKIGSK